MTMVEVSTAEVSVWRSVCAVSRLTVGRGISVLVDDVPVAVFLLADGSLHALSGTDPFSGATIMSRGLVGSIHGRAVVVSPMYKQRFDIETGVCLEDPAVVLHVFSARVASNGVIEVSVT
jgi:nitrite reductase (NADH) small subunit